MHSLQSSHLCTKLSLISSLASKVIILKLVCIFLIKASLLTFLVLTAISVCAPNPCRHKGTCAIMNKDKFICDCSKTGYQGPTCERGLVFLPTFPILHQGKIYTFTVTAKPDKDLKVNISSNDDSVFLSPRTLVFHSMQTNAIFQLRSSSPGMKVISFSLSGSDASSFEPINSRIIYVQTPAPQLNKVISDSGSISQGCHDRKVTTGEGKKIGLNLHSTAPWIDHAGKVSTEGILLMDVGGSKLPTSLVGSSITSSNLINSPFDEFIMKHRNGSSFGTDTSIKDGSESCITTQPSTNYLPEIVEINSFAKTVLDGVNHNIPFWINLIPEKTVKTFDIQDFDAKLLRGQEVRTKYAKCGEILAVVENDQQYYVHSTDQKISMQVNEEDINIKSDAKVCIFRSAGDNQTLIGFPNASASLKTLYSSTGWRIKANGILVNGNTSGSAVYHIFGKFSTKLTSDSGQVRISVEGKMTVTVNSEAEVNFLLI